MTIRETTNVDANSGQRIVRPDVIIANYLQHMVSEAHKNREKNTRFVYKDATRMYIQESLTDEEVFMMGTETCLNTLLKHWRDYRKTHPDKL